MKYLFTLAVLLTFLSCGNEPTKTEAPQTVKKILSPYVSTVTEAHQLGKFSSKKVLQADLQLFFRGNERLNATLTLTTDSRRGKITLKDGKEIYINDNIVKASPEFDKPLSVRFDAYTWSYFLLLPYKLTDEGTKYSSFTSDSLNNEKYLTQKLSFGSGVGDAPDDWYILYADEKTKLLTAAAYIVTKGKNIEEAEKEPHAIKYEDYITVDGIPFASKWTFWDWSEKEGLSNQLGNANITNIKFIDDASFEAPKDFIQID